LLALYDGKAAEAEKRAAQLREQLSTITDDGERRSSSYQIARQTNVMEESWGRQRDYATPRVSPRR
jgi:hypothetical protein